jgi:hypothetical protein
MKLLFWKQDTVTKQEFSATPLVDYIEQETYGTALLPVVTREEALSVPGVMRARNMIASIATLPLKTYAKDWKLVDNPLLRQIDPTRTNVATLADTLEDLLFNKYAYWRIVERDVRGYPVFAEYVDFRIVSEEEKDGDVTVRINGKVVSWADIIKFESPNPAFLKHGGRVVKRALDLDVTSAKYARNPMPLSYFRSTDPSSDPADDAGIKAFLQKWKRWFKSETTGYVPAGIEYVSVEQPTPAELQLIEAQKQVALNLANMTGLDPEDLGISTTSRTYQNAVDRRQDRINEVFAPYMRAITDRLSMSPMAGTGAYGNYVTKRGHSVQFDLADYMKADPKTRMEVQTGYLNARVTVPNEVREDEHRPPIPGGDDIGENTIRTE